MAKTTFLSAGVYTREFDLSFIPAPIPPVGACVIGPTVRGPVLMPTKVASYSEYLRWYGDIFESGSSDDDMQSYKYLTTYAVQEYLRWGDVVTVMRIDGELAAPAFTNIISSGGYTDADLADKAKTPSDFEQSMSFQLETIGDGESLNSISGSIGTRGEIYIKPTTGIIQTLNFDLVTTKTESVSFVSGSDSQLQDIASSIASNIAKLSQWTARIDDDDKTIVTASYQNLLFDGTITINGNDSLVTTVGSVKTAVKNEYAQFLYRGTIESAIGGDGNSKFISDASEGRNTLESGTRYNIRWEIANVDENRGTFDLYIRRGDDTDSRKVVLEQFSGITLDPNEPNYIVKLVGDQNAELVADAAGVIGIQMKGNYPNRSRFVRVSNVFKNTMNYIRDNAAGYKQEYTSSLPAETWGVFGGGVDDPDVAERFMYTNITRTNTQGYNLDSGENSGGYNAYFDALDILSNKDQYDYDLLFMPGIIADQHREVVTRAITMVEDRGDAFLVLDPTSYNQGPSAAIQAADGRNTNYAAFYWPWVQITDADLGGNYWVPASTQVAGVFAFNDYVSEKWFAPAGLNRGGLDMVVQAERTLTINDRDALYSKNVNPIATFPQNGPVVWGQKTLQKKRSALDRINVRRLLIAAKRHVANTSKYLVFEQNTAETRANFINITKPFFDEAVQKQGIYDYRIIIDERNNTPDVIDRNEMRAQIYLKPAKTAEFIIVDFLVLPTGAAFPIDNDQ